MVGSTDLRYFQFETHMVHQLGQEMVCKRPEGLQR